MKLLLVEDSQQLNKALSTILKRNSFVVDSAYDGEEALIFIEQYQYDIIVLDVMMPKLSGFEVLKIMREKKIETPVIMLTAKSTVEDKITGLDMGADDYLAKPFNTEELLARIRALLRRKPSYKKEDVLTFGDLSLDVSTATLSSGDKKVSLMNKELQIMVLLMNKQGSIASLDEISKSAWDIDSYSTSENVWVFISYLRKKIVKVSSTVKIKSIRYQGYYLEQDK
jgi:Response regulators consisting of a CheY-like receiver domain and a winged-helix DNA-binding domain